MFRQIKRLKMNRLIGLYHLYLSKQMSNKSVHHHHNHYKSIKVIILFKHQMLQMGQIY